MVLPEEGTLLRIFIGETDKHGAIPLYEWIVGKAKECGLAGQQYCEALKDLALGASFTPPRSCSCQWSNLSLLKLWISRKKSRLSFLSSMKQFRRDWLHSKTSGYASTDAAMSHLPSGYVNCGAAFDARVEVEMGVLR